MTSKLHLFPSAQVVTTQLGVGGSLHSWALVGHYTVGRWLVPTQLGGGRSPHSWAFLDYYTVGRW